MRNLYSILGVEKQASQADIKKAYRTLAKELHPDLNKDDKRIADRFKEVSAAYSILGDSDQRGKYDRGEIDENGNEKAAGFGGGFRPGGFSKRARREFDMDDAESVFLGIFPIHWRRQVKTRERCQNTAATQIQGSRYQL